MHVSLKNGFKEMLLSKVWFYAAFMCSSYRPSEGYVLSTPRIVTLLFTDRGTKYINTALANKPDC